MNHMTITETKASFDIVRESVMRNPADLDRHSQLATAEAAVAEARHAVAACVAFAKSAQDAVRALRLDWLTVELEGRPGQFGSRAPRYTPEQAATVKAGIEAFDFEPLRGLAADAQGKLGTAIEAVMALLDGTAPSIVEAARREFIDEQPGYVSSQAPIDAVAFRAADALGAVARFRASSIEDLCFLPERYVPGRAPCDADTMLYNVNNGLSAVIGAAEYLASSLSAMFAALRAARMNDDGRSLDARMLNELVRTRPRLLSRGIRKHDGVDRQVIVTALCGDAESTIRWLRNQGFGDDLLAALGADGAALAALPDKAITAVVAEQAIRRDVRSLLLVPDKVLRAKKGRLARLAVDLDPTAIRYVPLDLIDLPLARSAVERDGRALRWLPPGLIDADMTALAERVSGTPVADLLDGGFGWEAVEAAERRLGLPLPLAYKRLIAQDGLVADTGGEGLIEPDRLVAADDDAYTSIGGIEALTPAKRRLVLPIQEDGAGNATALDFRKKGSVAVVDLDHEVEGADGMSPLSNRFERWLYRSTTF